MSESTVTEGAFKEGLYRQLTLQTRALVAGEPNVIANLSNVSALVNLHLEKINWAGFYLWHKQDKQLVLGPFQGKPACLRIGLGKGVCGTAAKERRTMVVRDVLSFPGHIACDAESRSEIVVPLVQKGVLVGVLDIDSPVKERFDEEDARGLEQVMEELLAQVEFD